jgi:hypothetical protein
VEEVQDKKTIKIPKAIRTKTEFFDGFGMTELIKTSISMAIASIIAYVAYLFTHQAVYSTFFVLGVTIVSVMFVRKGRNNFSMLDLLKNLVRFKTIQKEYRYTRGDFYKTNK